MTAPLKIFIIYAREDTEYKEGLVRAFRLLKRQGLVEEWHDGNIKPGAKWEEEIGDNLRSADIILPLISYDFFGSDYIQNVEIEKAFERFEAGEVKILPIIVRKCIWQEDTRLTRLQALPRDGKPISSWADRDEAYTDIIESLKTFITDVYAERERSELRQQEEILAQQHQLDEQKRLKEEKRLQAAAQLQKQEEEIARRRKDEGRRQHEQEVWLNAQSGNTLPEYQAYLNTFGPAPTYKREALAAIKRIKSEQRRPHWPISRMLMISGLSLIVLIVSIVAIYWQPEKVSPQSQSKTPAKPEKPIVLPDMAQVAGGQFLMGNGSPEFPGAQPVHKVTVYDFKINKHEVTNEEFVEFLNAVSGNISTNGFSLAYRGNLIFTLICGDKKGACKGYTEAIEYIDNGGLSDPYRVVPGLEKHPVTMISWYGAVEYCNWLSHRHNLQPFYEITQGQVSRKIGANGYRLPTEAEWEYAARGGLMSKKYKYAGSNNIEDVLWYETGSAAKIHPVGQKKPNELGLYDLSGNVSEWVDDCWNDSFKGAPADGSAWLGGDCSQRMVRGGSWYYLYMYSQGYVYFPFFQVPYRYQPLSPAYTLFYAGFRIAQN